jgi:predicted nuclease of restriction endonuclease-like RecB superfamily
LIPETLCRYSVSKGFIYPAYLDERDYPWLASLIEVVEAHAGKPRRELHARLLEELPVSSPPGKRKLAAHVLKAITKGKTEVPLKPRKIRAAVFAAAGRTLDRPAALQSAASLLELTPEEVERFLFADLPGEKRVVPTNLSVQSLARETNLRLAQAILFRASEVVIELSGHSRAIVRYARWRGLICSVDQEGGNTRLVISGPFSLFRRTLLYGKALSELVPLLAHCHQFQLTATCVLKGQRPLSFRLTASDQVAFGPAPPSAFDSKVERAFAEDFRKLGTEWDLIREPEPLAVGNGLIFPDFSIQHRHDPKQRWLLEIIGFWTPEYLSRKLIQLERAAISNLILCVDEKLGCAENAFLQRGRTIFFRRKIDPVPVLAILETR